jgi:PAS domain-containing protein
MAANTVGTDDARAPADDPYRAVAEHLPDAAVVLFDLDLRIQLTTGTTMPDSDWLPERCVGRSLVDLAPPEQAEEELLRHRRQLLDAQQLARVGSWEWEIGSSRVSWSRGLYRIMGVDRTPC